MNPPPLPDHVNRFIDHLINSDDLGFSTAQSSQGGQLLKINDQQAAVRETPLSFMAYQWPETLNDLMQTREHLTPQKKVLLDTWNLGAQRKEWSITAFEQWRERVNTKDHDACLFLMIRQFNAFACTCRQQLRQHQAAEHKQQQDQARRNLKSAMEYVDALRQRYACLLVVRVDLGYRPEALDSVNLYDFSKARKRYFKHLKDQSALKSLKGYIWVIEEGDDKGLHLHGLFFFDGSQAAQDITLGQILGEHWISSTQGQGRYFNVNAEHSKQNLRNWQQEEGYRAFINECFPGEGVRIQELVLQAQAEGKNSLAIGKVEYHNEAAWHNLHLQLHYFTKLEQRILPEHRVGIRCFGKGLLPAPPVKPGRPRSA